MELKDIDVENTLNEAKALLEQEKDLSPAMKATMNMLILVVQLFVSRLELDSRHRPTLIALKSRPKNLITKTGEQKAHLWQKLEKVDKPYETQFINIDRQSLPEGHYTEAGFETRQVFDIHICVSLRQHSSK